MTRPGDEIPKGTDDRGHLRASHADRERVIDTLKAAFVQGRLERDEFDLRVGRALASRTYADLAALTTDVPDGLTRARPSELPGKSANKKKKTAAALACATLACPGLLAVLPPIPDGSPFLVPVMVVMFALFGAVATGWLVLFHAWLEGRAAKQSAQGLPSGGGGEAARRRVPADPAGQLPQVDRSPRQAAEATIRPPRPASPSLRTPNRAQPFGRRYAIGYPSH
jgi:Domain of unknown function (DUF1707)